MSVTTGSIPYRGFGGRDPPAAATPSSPAPEERRPLVGIGRRLRDLFNPRTTDLQRLLAKLEAQFRTLEVAHARYRADNDGKERRDPQHPANAIPDMITDVHFAGRSATDPAIVRLSTLLLDHDQFGCILEVWLNDNHIADAGAAAVASYLAAPSCSLLELWLGRNRIGPVGTRALAAALGDNAESRLKCLGLYLNPIGNGGAVALALMLKKNHTLTTVDLHGCFFDGERDAEPRRSEEIGITEQYGGGCGCKVITPYDGAEYMAQAAASGASAGAGPVTEPTFMHATQTFVAFNRINPTREQAAHGITASNKQVSYSADYKSEVQSDIALFLSDLRSGPAHEPLNDVEKSVWKECEWQRLYAAPERARAARAGPGGGATRDLPFRAHEVGRADGVGEVELGERSAPASEREAAAAMPEQRSWADLKRDITGSGGGAQEDGAGHSRDQFTISEAEE